MVSPPIGREPPQTWGVDRWKPLVGEVKEFTGSPTKGRSLLKKPQGGGWQMNTGESATRQRLELF